MKALKRRMEKMEKKLQRFTGKQPIFLDMFGEWTEAEKEAALRVCPGQAVYLKPLVRTPPYGYAHPDEFRAYYDALAEARGEHIPPEKTD